MVTQKKLFAGLPFKIFKGIIDFKPVELATNNDLYKKIAKGVLKKDPEEREEMFRLINDVERVYSAVEFYENIIHKSANLSLLKDFLLTLFYLHD